MRKTAIEMPAQLLPVSVSNIVSSALEVGRLLSSETDQRSSAALVAESCEILGRVIGADVAALRVIDQNRAAHYVAGWATTSMLDSDQVVLRMRDDIHFDKAILAVSIAQMPISVPSPDDLEQWRRDSPTSAQTLFCPIRRGKDTVGYLCYVGDAALPWNDDVIEAVMLASSVIGQFQLGVWAACEAERRRELANLVLRLSHRMSAVEPDRLLEAFADALAELGLALDAAEVTVWELDYAEKVGRRLNRWHAFDAEPTTGDVVPFADSKISVEELTEPLIIALPERPLTLVLAPGFGGLKPQLCLTVSRELPKLWSDWERNELASFADLLATLREKSISDARLAATFNEAPNGIALCSDSDEVVDCNRAYLDFLGLASRNDVASGPLGSIATELVPPHVSDSIRRDGWKHLDGVELPYRRGDGALVWGRPSTVRIGDGKSWLWLVHLVDITEQRQALETVRERATTDPLTGTANRHVITETLMTLLSSDDSTMLPPGQSACTAVLLDLDGFKAVNDEYGHAAGDGVLLEVARRLRAVGRPGDLIGRYGGDEFIVIFAGPISRPDAVVYANRLRACFVMPFEVGEQQVVVGASFGLAEAFHGDSPTELLARADAAMYREKTGSTDRLLDVVDLTRSFARIELAQSSGIARDSGTLTTGEVTVDELALALETGLISFWGQPIVHGPTGVPLGVELLARWQLPDHTVLLPSAFVGVAERSGLVVELGRQALCAAVELLDRWQSDPILARLGVNVNVSPSHLLHNLVGEVNNLVPHLPDGAQLGLEFVENALAAEAKSHFGELAQLRTAGVRVVIDDFGVGYSSLSRLQQFPVDNLKLDKSFIADIVVEEDRFKFFGALSRLLGSAGYPVTVEGVETSGQLALVRRTTVQAIQGFLLSHPAPIEETEERLRGFALKPGAVFEVPTGQLS